MVKYSSKIRCTCTDFGCPKVFTTVESKQYHPNICGFYKHLKYYRAHEIHAVVATAFIKLPVTVSNHFEGSLYCQWPDTTHHSLCLMIRGASEGYNDQAEGMTAVQEAVALSESSTQDPLMYQMS